MKKINYFNPLLRWYSDNARLLPWRFSNNPYHIYISEIVFQQTRIEQGLDYYKRIISKYPDVNALALASEDDFLKIWQGLGYYSRAHNLLKAARKIVVDFESQIPSNVDDLRKLPGIGPYTAAAIASIAYNKPIPVVDGNVKRVISRLFCLSNTIDSKEFTEEILSILNSHILHHSPADFNQSIMEAGALICKPTNPLCFECPMQLVCCAFKTGSPSNFPVKGIAVKRKTVFLHYVLLKPNDDSQSFYLVKRDHNGIWKGLYELPVCQSNQPIVDKSCFIQAGFPELAVPELLVPDFVITHQLTHRILEANVYLSSFSGSVPESWLLVEHENLANFPFHQLMHKILKHFNLND